MLVKWINNLFRNLRSILRTILTCTSQKLYFVLQLEITRFYRNVYFRPSLNQHRTQITVVHSSLSVTFLHHSWDSRLKGDVFSLTKILSINRPEQAMHDGRPAELLRHCALLLVFCVKLFILSMATVKNMSLSFELPSNYRSAVSSQSNCRSWNSPKMTSKWSKPLFYTERYDICINLILMESGDTKLSPLGLRKACSSIQWLYKFLHSNY